MIKEDLRGSLGGVGVFPLAAPLPKPFGGGVVHHLTVVAHLVGLRHVLETLLIIGRQTLEPKQTLITYYYSYCEGLLSYCEGLLSYCEGVLSLTVKVYSLLL